LPFFLKKFHGTQICTAYTAYKKLIRSWDSERELFYDDIVHVLENNKTYCSVSAELYKNFIRVKSDLQLNLKVVMSK